MKITEQNKIKTLLPFNKVNFPNGSFFKFNEGLCYVVCWRFPCFGLSECHIVSFWEKGLSIGIFKIDHNELYEKCELDLDNTHIVYKVV